MANITKAEHREDLARSLGVWWPVVASGSGSTTTLVSSAHVGYGDNFFKGWWIYLKSGTTGATDDGKYRLVTGYTSSTGTFTFQPAVAGVTVANVIAEVHPYRPDLYTEAARSAVRLAWPSLCVPTLDSSLTLTAGDFTYTLPTGISSEMVEQVMMEGSGDFDELPHVMLEDVSFNPAGTILWLNRTNPRRYRDVITNRKLYLFARKRLTALDRDTSFGSLTTDTTARIELDRDSRYWELFLMFSRAALYQTLAAQPQMEKQKLYDSKAKEYLEIARDSEKYLRMPQLENQYTGT